MYMYICLYTYTYTYTQGKIPYQLKQAYSNYIHHTIYTYTDTTQYTYTHTYIDTCIHRQKPLYSQGIVG